ncbi:MAG: hypothetical protein OEZ22_07845 [Spirochaetia bacterium]|nr:hypothetical protein [Spirochaetia bacterium]
MKKIIFILIFISLTNLGKIFANTNYSSFIVTNSMSLDYEPTSSSKMDEISPINMALLDSLIPGYGLISLGETSWGLSYMGIKLMGAGFIYFSYYDYLYKNSVYKAAKIRQADEPGILYFKYPKNRKKLYSVNDLRNSSESAFLLFLFSSLFETITYAVNFYHTYVTAEQKQRLSGPYYKLKITEMKTSYLKKSDNLNARYVNLNIGLGWQKKINI